MADKTHNFDHHTDCTDYTLEPFFTSRLWRPGSWPEWSLSYPTWSLIHQPSFEDIWIYFRHVPIACVAGKNWNKMDLPYSLKLWTGRNYTLHHVHVLHEHNCCMECKINSMHIFNAMDSSQWVDVCFWFVNFYCGSRPRYNFNNSRASVACPSWRNKLFFISHSSNIIELLQNKYFLVSAPIQSDCIWCLLYSSVSFLLSDVDMYWNAWKAINHGT